MKRNITNLLPLLALLSATGCSDKVAPEERVVEPIYLYAAGDGLSASTKATTEIVPFGTTIFASTQSGVYTTLNAPDEWQKAASVEADGSVSFTDNPQPSYPETGGWIYLVAVAPKVDEPAVHTDNGTVTYILSDDTPQDLLYAKEIRGSRWDNQRFSGNTVSANDKPLAYEHLLTQLTFKAKKAADGGLPVTVNKITVNDVKTSVTVSLADGAATFTDGTAKTLNLAPTHGSNESGSEIINSTTLVPLGTLLVPPLNQSKADGSPYTITVETSIGTFPDVPLTFASTATGLFDPGVSHEITLTISDTSLGITSVKVAGWTTVDKGQLEL